MIVPRERPPEPSEEPERAAPLDEVTIEASKRSIVMAGIVQRLSEVSRAMRDGQIEYSHFEKYADQDKPSVMLGHGRRVWFTGGEWYLAVDSEESLRAGEFGIRYLSRNQDLPVNRETLLFYPERKGASLLVKEFIAGLRTINPQVDFREQITIHDITNEKGFQDEQKLLLRGAKLAYKFARKHMPRERNDEYL